MKNLKTMITESFAEVEIDLTAVPEKDKLEQEVTENGDAVKDEKDDVNESDEDKDKNTSESEEETKEKE